MARIYKDEVFRSRHFHTFKGWPVSIALDHNLDLEVVIEILEATEKRLTKLWQKKQKENKYDQQKTNRRNAS